MARTSMVSIRPSRALAILGGALLVAALAACADGGPEPTTPSPEGPTGKAAVPFPIATESPSTATEAPSAAPTATGAPSAAPAPTASASAEPRTEIVIDLRVRDAKKEGGKLVHDADGNRMTATHRLYELDAAELEKALAAKKKGAKEARLRLACGPASTRVSPGDPQGAHPIGGFTYETRACTIAEVLSAE